MWIRPLRNGTPARQDGKSGLQDSGPHPPSRLLEWRASLIRSQRSGASAQVLDVASSRLGCWRSIRPRTPGLVRPDLEARRGQRQGTGGDRLTELTDPERAQPLWSPRDLQQCRPTRNVTPPTARDRRGSGGSSQAPSLHSTSGRVRRPPEASPAPPPARSPRGTAPRPTPAPSHSGAGARPSVGCAPRCRRPLARRS